MKTPSEWYWFVAFVRTILMPVFLSLGWIGYWQYGARVDFSGVSARLRVEIAVFTSLAGIKRIC